MKQRRCLPVLALLLLALTGCGGRDEPLTEKPVLYLYPEEKTLVSVGLDLEGSLTSSYPAYGAGWRVLAAPDGTLTDPETGRTYYCLFWEADLEMAYDFSTGFCVPGEETAAFLEEALADLGLTQREANEFLLYWLPRMEENPYNLISFETGAYTEAARLAIDPAPDTLLRVFMAWKGLEAPVEVAPQTLTAPARTGFTAVEWGGAEVVS